MPPKKFNDMREHLGEVIDINAAIALMHWDQEVYMPPKAAPARGRQLATLSAHAHALFTQAHFGEQLNELAVDPFLNDDETKLVTETLYDYDRATKLPGEFVKKFAEEQSKAYQAWLAAREASQFETFRPNLEILVDLLKEKAEFMGYQGSPYNALLEDYERGMTTEQLSTVFGELAPKQSALVQEILDSDQQPDTSWLKPVWDTQAQWDFTMRVLEDIGYDLEAGRQDKSVHPFTTNFDLYDVRITTRLSAEEPFSSLTGSIHEGGHALYEQGFRDSDRRTTLAQAPSLGIHESQSRMWENIVGRSLPFWKFYTPIMRGFFKGKLDSVTPDQIHRAINVVRPTFIRVEADECTYNLHIILRFEIEVALIEGKIGVADIPDIWNEKMKQYLGLDVPDDARGCLQDIHWSHGSIGYFPTYTLGNLYAAQLFEKIEQDVANLWGQIGSGNFVPLLDWLRENVHKHGRRKTAIEIVRDATQKEPTAEAYLRYLETKYRRLYASPAS